KSTKVFKPLTNQQLESVVGGPITSRGTETTVQPGTA
ncbi:bacteriocin, partial [Flavobacterium sp. LC2016-23]|nr:bacteriocin [Flavobacterium sp. LC2016-23]